jgi:hypothetical protein
LRLRLQRVAALFFVPVVVFSATQDSPAQNSRTDRVFPQPVAVVQAALKKLPGGTSGRLPGLDGFVVPGAQSLSSYQRPYYHCDVQVTPAAGGKSLVKVTAKINAWFSSPEHSGYEALESSGRIESDLLDRLQDALAATSASKTAPPAKLPDNPPALESATPEINAPVPVLPDHPALTIGPSQRQNSLQDKDLQQEAKNLEEILRGQSHPTNLVAVKQNGTPVLQSPSLDAKILFLASAEDEFEVLEQNPGWVHVRISGLSRGWLRSSTVEILNDSQPRASNEPIATNVDKPAPGDAKSPAAFSVNSEEVGSFPGEWAPLKGKNVKIISIQQAPGTGRITSPQEKKQFAEGVFKKESPGLTADAAGLVLIFDAEDGGMLATTRSSLEQWARGTLTNAGFWKQCFLDPPEILGAN